MTIKPFILLGIGLIFGAGIGIVIAPGDTPKPAHDHASHSDAAHDHSETTMWDASLPTPEITLELLPDGDTSRNLHIITTGFTFAPQLVNGQVTPGTGHAHVYINGVKFGRAYGPWLQLTGIPEGPLTVRVTLNANDHTSYMAGGEMLAAEITQ